MNKIDHHKEASDEVEAEYYKCQRRKLITFLSNKKNLIWLLVFLVIMFFISLKYSVNEVEQNSILPVTQNNRAEDEKPIVESGKNIYGLESSIKFDGNNYNLYFVEPINNGLAMYYRPKEQGDSSKSELIINQYSDKVTAKGLSGGIIKESEKNGDELYSPFTAPDSHGRESYYITSRTSWDYDGKYPTIYVMKIFEDSGFTYSLIYKQKLEGKDEADTKSISDKWFTDNLIKIGSAIETLDLSGQISFYNTNKELFSRLSKSNKYTSLKWKTETIKEDNANAAISIEYPKFIGGTEVVKLNDLIKTLATENLSSDKELVNDWIKNGKSWVDLDGVKQYEKYLPDLWSCRDAKEYDYECSVNVEVAYQINSVINDIVSLELIVTDYTGGGNGNHSRSITVNYDLKSDKELEASELFCNSDYADEFFKIAEIDLVNKFPYLEAGTIFDNEIPKADNFKDILLNEWGVTLVFQPYQVTSGAAGIVKTLIPYSSLENAICLP